MLLKSARTPDGNIVVRETDPGAERAWLLKADGSVRFCGGHKGPFVGPTEAPHHIVEEAHRAGLAKLLQPQPRKPAP